MPDWPGISVHTLCDGPLVIQIGGGSGEAHLRVRGGSVARFTFDAEDFAQLLRGVPIHLAAPGEAVMLMQQGDSVRLVYTKVEGERSHGSFALSDLRDALDEIRG